MKLILNSSFPELVAKGVCKWYLFNYDEFLNKKIIGKVSTWALDNNIGLVKIDINKYFGREDFLKFKEAVFHFSVKNINGFLNQEVLEGHSRELFLESAYITDNKKVVIYLEKNAELVLFGLSNPSLVKSFENIVMPYLNSTLLEKLNYIFDYPLRNHPKSDEFKNRFIINYFKNEFTEDSSFPSYP